jgi:uncharacterized protein with HEPN domain
MKDDRLYLVHMDECIARIEQYVIDGRQAFMDSILIQDAVLRNLQTLAESTQRLSDSLKARFPEIDWVNIAGFRNVLVHGYLGVDIARCWEIVDVELPSLKRAVQAMLKDTRSDD